MSNTNEEAQSEEVNPTDWALCSIEMLVSRISQLESDLAKSQEKCKAYEGANNELLRLLKRVKRVYIDKDLSNVGAYIDYYETDELIEQALKPTE